jgi:hypothetical protein
MIAKGKVTIEGTNTGFGKKMKLGTHSKLFIKMAVGALPGWL